MTFAICPVCQQAQKLTTAGKFPKHNRKVMDYLEHDGDGYKTHYHRELCSGSFRPPAAQPTDDAATITPTPATGREEG
jgi:hypothetical protein